MAPKQDLNLPEGEQKDEAETENTVGAAEQMATIEENTAASADIETINEKVSCESELAPDEAFNMEESEIIDTDNIAAENSALLEENEAISQEQESLPTPTLTLSKEISEDQNQGSRESCFLTEIADSENVDQIVNPQDAVSNISNVDLELKCTGSELETENIDKHITDDVETSLDSVGIIDTVQDIIKTETCVIEAATSSTNEAEKEEIEDIYTEIADIKDTEIINVGNKIYKEGAESPALFDEKELKTRPISFADIDAILNTAIEDIRATTIPGAYTEETTKTSTIEAETQNIKENAVSTELAPIEITEEEAKSASIDNSDKSANIENIEAPTENVSFIASEGTSQTANIEDIKKEVKSALLEDTVASQTAPAEIKTAKAESVSINDTRTESLATQIEDLEEEPGSVPLKATPVAAHTSAIEDAELGAPTSTLEYAQVGATEQVEANESDEDTETEANLIAHEEIRSENETKDVATNFLEDIKKEFSDAFIEPDKMRDGEVAVANANGTNCSQDEALSPVNALPFGKIALATIIIFLALIMFYN